MVHFHQLGLSCFIQVSVLNGGQVAQSVLYRFIDLFARSGLKPGYLGLGGSGGGSLNEGSLLNLPFSVVGAPLWADSRAVSSQYSSSGVTDFSVQCSLLGCHGRSINGARVDADDVEVCLVHAKVVVEGNAGVDNALFAGLRALSEHVVGVYLALIPGGPIGAVTVVVCAAGRDFDS